MKTCQWMLFFICLLISSFLEARASYGNLVVEKVHRVHDGDTFIAEIQDVPPLIGHEISIRIKGMDAPEITDKRASIKELAILSRDYLKKRLSEAMLIELINVQRDKYFRILAEVYIDGVNIAEEMIQLGFAQPYDGKKKPEWPMSLSAM